MQGTIKKTIRNKRKEMAYLASKASKRLDNPQIRFERLNDCFCCYLGCWNLNQCKRPL